MSLTRYDCALDGMPLRGVSDAIFITDIVEEEPSEQLTVIPYTVRMGSNRVRKKRDSLTVSISFVVGERDINRRKAIAQRVQEWARSGAHLTTNDRPGQRLRVICEALPRLSSAQKWQQVLNVQFAAYELPYWEDEIPTTATTAGSTTMYVSGTAENTLCSVRVANTGSTSISSVTVAAGVSKMVFSGISLAADGALEIGYTEGMLLYARIGNVSVLDKRTDDSDDDLYVPCGRTASVSVSSDGTATATFSARGLYE